MRLAVAAMTASAALVRAADALARSGGGSSGFGGGGGGGFSRGGGGSFGRGVGGASALASGVTPEASRSSW